MVCNSFVIDHNGRTLEAVNQSFCRPSTDFEYGGFPSIERGMKLIYLSI